MTEPSSPGFFSRLAGDYRCARTYLQANRQARAFTAERDKAHKELQSIHSQIGAKALELGIGKDLPIHSKLETYRAQAQDVAAALRQKEEDEKAAREALAAETDQHTRTISALQADHDHLSQAASAARTELDQLKSRIDAMDRQIRKTQSEIDNATKRPPNEPVEQLKEKVSSLSAQRQDIAAQLPAAQQKYDEAAAALSAKAGELKRCAAGLGPGPSKRRDPACHRRGRASRRYTTWPSRRSP